MKITGILKNSLILRRYNRYILIFMIKKYFYYPLIFLVVLLMISACVSQKKILYLQRQQKNDTNTAVYSNKRATDYRIQPKDNLYIRIFSLDEKTYSFFNKQSIASGLSNDFSSDASVYLNSYTVNSSGYIDFPVVGKILVRDMTVEEAKNAIQKSIDEYLKETTVVVKMVNFNITVVGEVYHPGKFRIYQDEITVFDAISLAGDMRDFAARNKVVLIRQVKDGSKVYYLNLNSDKILNSDLYYLMPNDIVYIPPLKSKQYGFEAFPYTVLLAALTTISTLILTIYTVKKL